MYLQLFLVYYLFYSWPYASFYLTNLVESTRKLFGWRGEFRIEPASPTCFSFWSTSVNHCVTVLECINVMRLLIYVECYVYSFKSELWVGLSFSTPSHKHPSTHASIFVAILSSLLLFHLISFFFVCETMSQACVTNLWTNKLAFPSIQYVRSMLRMKCMLCAVYA